MSMAFDHIDNGFDNGDDNEGGGDSCRLCLGKSLLSLEVA